jgi:curved DNA-binding protein CbpA
MNDPYETLGLPRHANDAEIRRRYVELVREFSPERAPERFAQIRAAYDAVRDPARRLEALLFEVETDDTLSSIVGEVRARLRKRLDRIPTDALLALAETS